MSAKFILWDTKDGAPRVDEETGEITSDGAVGRITAENAFLAVYASYPDARRPVDLEVGESIPRVTYSLSGGFGMYDVIRVS